MNIKRVLLFILLFLLSCKDNTQKTIEVKRKNTESVHGTVNFFGEKYSSQYSMIVDESTPADHPIQTFLDCDDSYFTIHYIPKTPELSNFWKNQYSNNIDTDHLDFEKESEAIELIVKENISNYQIFCYYIPSKYIRSNSGCTIESVYLEKNTIAEVYSFDTQKKEWDLIKKLNSPMLPQIFDSEYFMTNFPKYFDQSSFPKQTSNETRRSSFETYKNNQNYFVRTFDVNQDGILDKIVSSKAYQEDTDLFIFYGDKKNTYNLVLETTNFSEDGGNVVEDIYPLKNEEGYVLKTYFPDRGFYEKEYFIVPQNNTWILKKIIYKTMSDNSENAVKYICDVTQNLDITKSGWSEKINDIPAEDVRIKRCKVENSKNNQSYFIQDTGGYTNLRQEKNANSKILQKIESGIEIQVLDSKGDWYLIKTIEGNKGYVHKSRVKYQ